LWHTRIHCHEGTKALRLLKLFYTSCRTYSSVAYPYSLPRRHEGAKVIETILHLLTHLRICGIPVYIATKARRR
ncbi:MAG TPA: hypothetical protein PKV73_07395, partial [Agriterribacter sp.]|nr:hypothetical protein [Agriterribacter sp.]